MKVRSIDIYDESGYYYTTLSIAYKSMEDFYHQVMRIMASYPPNWYYED